MVTSASLTTEEVQRVRGWAVANGNTSVQSWCDLLLAQPTTPPTDPGTVNKDRTRVAETYDVLWPDPVVTFTSSGTWTAPSVAVDGFDVTSVAVECFGPGGAGGASLLGVAGGGGGGGGAYARVESIPVVPGQSYAVQCGTGLDSWFQSALTVLAKAGSPGSAAVLSATPGTGGAGGSAASSVGDVTFSGGAGANGTLLAQGAGGGAAGETGAGGNASGTTPGAGNYFSGALAYGGGSGGSTGAGSATGGGGAGGSLAAIPGSAGGGGAVQLYYAVP